MITDFDKKLLNSIQRDLPLGKRPFSLLAEKLNTEETIIIERIKILKEQGLIRRIGPFFDSGKLGYIGTLVALKIKPNMIPQVAAVINSYYGVTHNYEREGAFNLWFTLLSFNITIQEQILDNIRNLDGVVQLISLPAAQKFKVNVQFSLV